ncbi:serine/arginine-rich SC35-like splicing factor SCL28 isoform X2 [Cryptomeria japonica]|uniref:serine/arginine-rich SC35-like splicing factor SCL28 isoform X2 n=1 Tax=Cryptomeria japonica TaxID=3369 RepID=UPI0027D9E0FA|nr:serine/arginine-rich SC35-like splicing factor SCL28 isoform X2 [Cryptomeria japonica]
MGKRGESRSRSRSRGRSYSPSPSPLPRHRRSYDSRDRFRDRCLPFPTCLLVRNIARQTRPEDLRIPFEKFGMVKDVYLPRNYYSGEPRGFGFVKYANPDDAAEAKHYMNHQVINGREISIVFAEENRKNPDEMRLKSRKRYGGGSYRRHTPPRSPRWRRSYSHSESPPYRSTSIFCDRNSHSSNSRSHDSPPFLNRPRDSLSPRGRTHYSPPLRRISRDSSLPRDRLCNSSPLRSKYCDSPPSRNRYPFCDSLPPRDGLHDSFSSRLMPTESYLYQRAQDSPARGTSHVSTLFWGNLGDSSLPNSRPYHSNLFSIQEQIS